MKKIILKTIVISITIILSIFTLIAFNSNNVFASEFSIPKYDTMTWDKLEVDFEPTHPEGTVSRDIYKYGFSSDVLKKYLANLSCVRAYGDSSMPVDVKMALSGPDLLHRYTMKIELKGENAKFYAGEGYWLNVDEDPNNDVEEGTLIHESNCKENDIMAAACWHMEPIDPDNIHVVNSSSVIWYYWDAWLDASLGSDKSFIHVHTNDYGLDNVPEAGDYIDPDRDNALIKGAGKWYDAMVLSDGTIMDLTHSRYVSRNVAILDNGEDYGYLFETLFSQLAEKYDCEVTIYHFADRPADSVAQQHFIMLEKGDLTENGLEVTKKWIDGEHKEKRSEIKVQLYEVKNGVETLVEGKTLTLNEDNNWTAELKGLPEYDENNELIYYTIKEIVPEGYEEIGIDLVSGTMGSNSASYIITNVLTTDVKVVKEWYDQEDLDGYRPTSLKVTLYANGVSTGKTITLDANNNWTATFEYLHKYDLNGNEIKYTVQEEKVPKYETPIYSETKDSNGNTVWTIKNTHNIFYDGYIEITGKVWNDEPDVKSNKIDGILNENDKLLEGITVRLKYIDENGNHSIFSEMYPEAYETKTNANGEYKIQVNYDNSQSVYKLYEDVTTVNKKLETAYVEFEYDGLKYTTVANADTGANTSKAVENETSRNNFDSTHSNVTTSSDIPEKWKDKNITATTQTISSYEKSENETREVVIKYCNGNGTYDRTDPDAEWVTIKGKEHNCKNCKGTGHEIKKYGVKVEIIPNINLGLFEREKPDVAIFSDLSKVEVTMNKQKYTYLYGVKTDESNDVGLKAKFQNKYTYTYRRPVNPADIAFIQEETNQNAMSVLVTYQVRVANLSDTLSVTINNIINSFDSQYTLINPEGWTVTDATGFKQATSGDLNITLEPQTESSELELTYTVSLDAIRNLLNEEATLNNAVEIGAYSTKYGTNTVYAQQQKGERAGKTYGGYDYDSHPGNAGLFINGNGRLEATKPEDDTDIAPSFTLIKDDTPKTLAGTVWEDLDDNKEDEERLGNGYREDTEAKAENVKIELYNKNGELAKLYNKETKQLDRDAIVYSEADGSYSLDGVVTGEQYFIKFTYGDDTTELGHEATTMNGGATKVNARNYKSTIITEETIKNILGKDVTAENYDFEWPLKHDDKYSVAVDNMVDRTSIGALTYGTYTAGENMTAYTKPFIVKLEFDETDASSSVKTDEGNRQENEEMIEILGNIEDATHTLNKFSFGIIERPRENLLVQKTITNVKVTLANGQVLLEGNPSDSDVKLNYTKAMGFRVSQTVEEARAAMEKLMLIEIDSELIQSAQLDVTYAVHAINNNEIDYDYGDTSTYGDIKAAVETGVFDKYITKSTKARYYYYGDKSEFTEDDILESTIKFVDYLDNELVYSENNKNWNTVNLDTLNPDGDVAVSENDFISPDVYNELKNGTYKILQTNINDDSTITLERGETFSQEMKVSRLLSNKEENIFDNNAEIIEIDGKTGRTIKAKYEDGRQLEYVPGNYVPGGSSETDDDRVRIIITPPTGLANQTITYVIAAVVGLVIVVIGVIYIKKKRLIK